MDATATAALAVIIGLVAATLLPALPSPAAVAGAGAIGLLLWLLKQRLAGWTLLALAWSLSQAHWRLHQNLPPAWEQQDIRLEGTIADIPQPRDENLRFDLKLERLIEPPNAQVPPLIRLSWYRIDRSPKAGEHWQLTVRLKRPHGYFNPGGLDYEQWLFLQGIRATGYVREDADNRLIGSPPSPWNPQTWRQRVFDRLTSALSGHPLAGIVIALTMGEESAIAPDQWEVLRRTGTTHLIAVSGSHIGLIAGLVYFATRRLAALLPAQRLPPPDVAALASLAAAILYSALAGFSVPTQRALVMIAVVMIGSLGRRATRPMHSLLLASLAVSLYDPFCVLAPGFWLSFGAVAIILLDLGYRLRAPGWWASLWRINWITAVGLAPLLLLFFQQVSLVSPIANLLGVPTLGLAGIPLCLTATLLLFLAPAVGDWALTATGAYLEMVWRLLEVLAQLPLAQWEHPPPPAWALPLALLGTILLLAPRGIRGRWLGGVLWLPALTAVPQTPELGAFRLTLLDVGQGLAAVIQTRNHALVFDTGARFGPDFDLGSAVIAPFLHNRGIERLDTLVVSHGDNDHAGGAESVLKEFPPASIISSVAERYPEASSCRAGQSWTWDGVNFAMLGPLQPAPNDNDNSCVLKVATGAACALLTGDIEKPAELQLVDRYGDGLHCQVVVAPHHGSNSSSSAEFLSRLRPSYGLIPAGYRNRWRFPHPEVVARYRAAGAEILTSAEAGAITVDVDPDGLISKPKIHRLEQGRFWNDRP
ncbi:MAG: DNA internalization-related competence protein ComEC/Rec2 [Methylococcaceae bacterium]|nr:DNA internalization-related competence protein ComEC/Rec2 [Methylococcaceae bacterium]